MVEINPTLFKKYDIRGRASGEKTILTPEVGREIGHGFGTYLYMILEIDKVVIGRDNRVSSSDLQTAFMEGLTNAGLQVFDLGLIATPVMYWHAVNKGEIGGVMVTGSHLGAEQNGFKLCVGNRPIFDDQIQIIKSLIDNQRLFYGDGEIIVEDATYSQYVYDLEKRIPKPPRPLKVVVDAGNGTGGLFARRLIELWGHTLMDCLFCEPDGTFPNHHPNPQEAENMRDLGIRVRELGADIGIAFDGDSDRMGAVDEHGEMIAADRVVALLAQDMLARYPNAVVVADVLSSQVLFDAVKNAGGQPIMAASGHALVKESMRESGALLGGEMSGHIFLGEDYYGFDDGFMAAGRLLQLLAVSNQSLSQLNAALPTLYSTPEYRPHCPDEDKRAVIEAVTEALREHGESETVDGFRIKFARGWGLLRASNTEPVLSLRFEGETEAEALAYRELFVNALKAFPQVEALL
ncbi:MAG: phosphomannomutase/phosphoglucomutase [Aggregatilineales bacterium]